MEISPLERVATSFSVGLFCHADEAKWMRYSQSAMHFTLGFAIAVITTVGQRLHTKPAVLQCAECGTAGTKRGCVIRLTQPPVNMFHSYFFWISMILVQNGLQIAVFVVTRFVDQCSFSDVDVWQRSVA